MCRFSFILLCVVLMSGCSKKLSNTVANVGPSVVHIEKMGAWQGSGFVLTEDGLICTAKHVVEGGGEFIVTFDDGTKISTKQSLYDSKHDIGFLKVEPEKMLRPLRLVPFDLRAGDPVFIMGSPLGKDNFNSVTLGIVSAKKRDLSFLGPEAKTYGWSVMFQSDSAAYPGNSGGPVFDMNGDVVGVLVAGMDASLNYSVPVEVFMDELDIIKLKFRMLRFEVPEPPKVQEEVYYPQPEEPTTPEEPENPNPDDPENPEEN